MIQALRKMASRYLDATTRLINDGRLVGLLLVPYFISITVFFLLLVVGFFNFEMVKRGLLSGLTGLEGAADWITFFAIPILAIFGAVLTLLGAFQLVVDRVLENILKERQLKLKAARGGVDAFLRISAEMAVRLLLVVVLSVLLLATLLIPIINIFSVLLGALYLGSDLFGMCFSSLRIDIGAQMSLLWRHLGEVFLVGLFTTGLLLVPVLGIFLFPVSFVVAAELIAEWYFEGDEHIVACLDRW